MIVTITITKILLIIMKLYFFTKYIQKVQTNGGTQTKNVNIKLILIIKWVNFELNLFYIMSGMCKIKFSFRTKEKKQFNI